MFTKICIPLFPVLSAQGFGRPIHPGLPQDLRSGRLAIRLALAAALASPLALAQTGTTTTLAAASANGAVTTVAAGSVVTLTAAVAGATVGQVEFCDATAPYCTDVHLLRKAQLTSAGVATYSFIPGIGAHSYKAVYVGTTVSATSSSSAIQLIVTGTHPSSTSISSSGSAGNYSLTATVVGTGNPTLALTGTVSFLDATNNSNVLGTASLGSANAGLSFTNSASPRTGDEPSSVAVGDFNHDGISDLAVVNTFSNTVTVLLGDGKGNFNPAGSSYQTGSQPQCVAVGDFNGDGAPDLAVTNADSNTVTVLLGDGKGNFIPTASSPQTGSFPFGIAVGDFNGDGLPDLAVANGGNANLTVLLGDGKGNFTPTASNPQTGVVPVSVVVGDFNGDGVPDLAVANESSNTVTVLFGDGKGDFPTASNFQTGSEPASIAVGDSTETAFPTWLHRIRIATA